MEGWNRLSASLAQLNLGEKASGLAKGFGTSVQVAKERLGTINPEDITELPQEYKDLEARVDALRLAHINFLRLTKCYESESYDYPTAINESITEIGTTISSSVTNFAATNLKGTAIPAPEPVPAQPVVHKTLPHALGRTASAIGQTLPNERLGKALTIYGSAWNKASTTRIQTDGQIRSGFLAPWQLTLNTSIDVAMKARAAVRSSRLELDARKAGLKSTNPARAEQARLEVENAEDDLVQKTEVAIGLMKAVLENPEPLIALSRLLNAQLAYHAAAVEALSAVQGEVEELATAAEGAYRKSRDH